MTPFAVGGGLLHAVGSVLAGPEVADTAAQVLAGHSLPGGPTGGMAHYLGAVTFALGTLALSLLVPALAGYIAFSVAGRPGGMPGFTVGLVATTVGAGYLGGLAGGLLAGLVVRWLVGLPVPGWARGLMPIAVVPLAATVLAGGLMTVVLGPPLAAVTRGTDSWLMDLASGSALLLGAALGAMMAFDLGGPLNKAAYLFATAGLAAGTPVDRHRLTIMAAVVTAGMVPPLALALATTLRPALFTAVERESGKAAWMLGGAFVTEGAIPFAAADPLRVIPAITLGSATAGGLTMWANVTLYVPHGGLFVLFAFGNIAMFLAALVVGTLIACAAVLAAKQLARGQVLTSAEPASA
jgi:PTS system fructose-specific IIC component